MIVTPGMLAEIAIEAVARCDPGQEMDRRPLPRMPVDVLAIGKSAASLWNAASARLDITRGLVVVPRGYEARTDGHPLVLSGSHPFPDSTSFAAGRAVLEFVSFAANPVVLLLSGGSSACAEVSREGLRDEELEQVVRALVQSDLPIERINCVRRHLSAIKGGALAARAAQPITTWIESDVRTGHPEDVGSGPTIDDGSTEKDAADVLSKLSDPESLRVAGLLRSGMLPPVRRLTSPGTVVLADNGVLVSTAAAVARALPVETSVMGEQIELPVVRAADLLVDALVELPPGTLLIAGGEPTLEVRGGGLGGRCSELALRLLVEARRRRVDLVAAIAASDGADGNSGVAGFSFETGEAEGAIFSREPARSEAPASPTEREIYDAFDRSDTFSLMRRLGQPIMMPTGRNLRDLFLLARR